MSTRSGLRPRKSAVEAMASPTVMITPAARKGMKATVANSTKFDSVIDRDATPEQLSTIDTLMDTPAPATAQPLYPNLDALTANTTLYPTLESKTPARRRLYASATTGRKVAGRKSLATQTVLPVTPTKPIDNSTVPKTTTFEFKFSAGLEEAGKKVLEELKLSSVALQAHMKEEAAKRAAGLEPGSAAEVDSTPAAARSRRFSDQHRKQFTKMASIADHYSARRAKAAVNPVTPRGKKADTGEAKSAKTLKRKAAPEESKPSTPFKPPATLVTSDTEMADESPISRKKARIDGTPMTQPRKIAKFQTPGPLTATPISKPLQAAGHQHGLSRSVAVKHSAMIQSSLPRVIRKEAAPSTPSKPIAVATPLKKETLLASPSKIRPPGTSTKPSAVVTQPGTPSPVKISVPISAAEAVEFRPDLKAPVFDMAKLHKFAAAAPRHSVRFADEKPDFSAANLPAARSLFDSGIVLKPTEKRKAVTQEDESSSSEDEHTLHQTATTRNKRVRMDVPDIKLIANTPMKGASPLKSTSLLASVARKMTQPIRNSRISQLATPKRRTVLSPKTDGKKVSKPRWK